MSIQGELFADNIVLPTNTYNTWFTFSTKYNPFDNIVSFSLSLMLHARQKISEENRFRIIIISL